MLPFSITAAFTHEDLLSVAEIRADAISVGRVVIVAVAVVVDIGEIGVGNYVTKPPVAAQHSHSTNSQR